MTTLALQDNHLGKTRSLSGQVIDLRQPDPDSILMADIIEGLGNVCRFGGQCRPFYSVAQHSVLVAALAPADIRREALLHDSPEAYLGDVVKPLKLILGDVYTDLEDAFEAVISAKYGLTEDKLLQVKKYDWQAVVMEDAALKNNNPDELKWRFRAINRRICAYKFGPRLPIVWDAPQAAWAFGEVVNALLNGQDILKGINYDQ